MATTSKTTNGKKTAAAKPAARAVTRAPAKAPAKAASRAASPRTATAAAAAPAAQQKPAVRTDKAAKPEKAAKPPKAAKPARASAAKEDSRKPKQKKVKLVRDSFTMPEPEYAVLAEVKKACLAKGFEVKKSELLRVGVALIRTLDGEALQKWVQSLPPLKAGRPRKEKPA